MYLAVLGAAAFKLLPLLIRSRLNSTITAILPKPTFAGVWLILLRCSLSFVEVTIREKHLFTVLKLPPPPLIYNLVLA